MNAMSLPDEALRRLREMPPTQPIQSSPPARPAAGLGADFDHALAIAVEEEGKLGEALDHHFAAAGGFGRARLALDASEALGLDRSIAISLAVACELLHNASLVHDDLQDRDELRRGQLAVWARFGEDVAISVGDFLLTRAFEIAAAAPIAPQHALDVMSAFTRATTAVIRGQIEDNAHANDPTHELSRFIQVARAKTGPLLALPVQAAIAATDRTRIDAKAVIDAFHDLGVAYQIQDDIADLMNRKRRAAGSDLRACRLNVVVALHRELVDPAITVRIEAARAFALSRPDHLESLTVEIAASPAIDHAFDFADQMTRHAQAHAAAMPAGLRGVFERCAERLMAPLEQLRRIHDGKRLGRSIEIEQHRHAEEIPVYS